MSLQFSPGPLDPRAVLSASPTGCPGTRIETVSRSTVISTRRCTIDSTTVPFPSRFVAGIIRASILMYRLFNIPNICSTTGMRDTRAQVEIRCLECALNSYE